MGWLYPFRPRPWGDIADEFRQIAAARPGYRHMSDIADSAWAAGSVLLGTTSLGDLIVADRPVPRAPWGALVVTGPWSPRTDVAPGRVRVEHVGADGEADERPVDEAVPLFWCFVTRKFGVVPPVSLL